MEIPFWKLEGIGNDFIVVKERDISMVEDESSFVKEVCHRRLGLGADGLMVVKESEVADVKMRYYNQDAQEPIFAGTDSAVLQSMCTIRELSVPKNFRWKPLQELRISKLPKESRERESLK